MSQQAPAKGLRPPKRASFEQGGRLTKKQRKAMSAAAAGLQGSNDEILHHEIRELIADAGSQISVTADQREKFTEVDVTISKSSSTGDGLGYAEGSERIYVIPFAIERDVVRAKVIRHSNELPYSVCDFIKVLKPSPTRNDALVECPYFASCSGCQFQMMPYDAQLAQKRHVVERAYHNFSGLAPAAIPTVADTVGSPLQYGYRTKLTPHFDGPPGGRHAGRRGEAPKFDKIPSIGFMQKGTRHTLDIEQCPIGTEAVQKGLKKERMRVGKELDKYRRGATLLLRESTTRLGPNDPRSSADEEDVVMEDRGDGIAHAKRCVTVHNSTTTEYVDDFIFENPASAFFQNNNSILPKFTQYIRDHILSSSLHTSNGESSFAIDQHKKRAKPKNLIDAYSGSGLFTITLSEMFERSIGIDVSSQSIDYARTNVRLNGVDVRSRSHFLSPGGTQASAKSVGENGGRSISFLAADAGDLFASVPDSFLPEETAVVIDPPRKGCDENFLRQLVIFAPERIIYVSCNVHTQARDVGWILRRHMPESSEDTSESTSIKKQTGEAAGPQYILESLQGFDFFPQTSHVESVAVLQKVYS